MPPRKVQLDSACIHVKTRPVGFMRFAAY